MRARLIVTAALLLATVSACRNAEIRADRPAANPRLGRAFELLERAEMAVYRSDYARAVADFHEVIEIYQDLGLPEEEAAAWSALAAVYIVIGGDDHARTALDRGRELAQRSGLKKPKAIIEAVVRLHDLMARNAPLDEVQRQYNALCELAGVACADSMVLGIKDASIGIMDMHAGRYEAGRERLQKAVRQTSSPDLRAMYYAAIGGSHVMQRNAGPATDAFIRAVEELERALEMLDRDSLLTPWLDDRELYSAVLVELLAGQGRVEEALSYSERARGRAFLQRIGNRRINSRNERIASEMEALRTVSTRRAPAELQKVRARYRELLARVEAANPEYSSLIDIEPLDVPGIQQQIPAGTTTVVSFFVTTTTVHVWIIERTRLDYVPLEVSPADLQRAVCWARSLGSAGGGSRSMYADGPGCTPPMTGEQAFTALLAPLLPHLRNERLLIVPHGSLHYVPFAALRNPATKRYVVEDFVVTYAPSISALKFLREKESPFERRALVIGDAARPGARRLPGAQREARVIASRFGTRPFVGSEAHEGLLYQAAGKFDLIHLGVHGEYNADDPLFSRLVLAPDAAHDGFLAVHEILAGVDLSGVNLVVLSACGSGRGAPTGGDEIVSLTRAVHYAGSPAVISTLWDIDDDATVAFMDELYARLDAGSGIADAVRGAQLALLSRAPYRDPVFWAAFTLSGDPVTRWALNVRDRRPPRR